jgi:hypothetical protein
MLVNNMKQPIAQVILIFLIVSHTIAAQPFSWAIEASGQGAWSGTAMAQDEQKNIYVCGPLRGQASFGSINLSGNGSFFTKYNQNGQATWAVYLPGMTCRAVAADIYGYSYVTGNFQSTSKIGDTTITNNGPSAIFLARFDGRGRLAWIRKGSGLGNDIAYGVANDLFGNTFVTGSFESFMDLDSQTSVLSSGKGDVFIAKYDSLGRVLWANKAGGIGEDAGVALSADLSGNVYLTGRFSGNAIFHNKDATSKGGYDIFITKYNSLGLQLFLQTYGGSGDDVPAAIGLDGSSNMCITGTFSGTADFSTKQLKSTKKDAFLAQFDKAGAVQWAVGIGGSQDDIGTGVSVDAHSNVFVTGVFSGKADFGDGTTLKNIGKSDIFVAKYDGGGNLKWKISAGGTNGSDTSRAVCVDHDDIALITGSIRSDASFGNISLKGDSGSFFVAKLAQDPSGIGTYQTYNKDLNIFPNPSNGVIYINGNELAERENQFTLSDLTGKIIETGIMGNNGLQEIDLVSQPSGIYFIRINNKNGTYAGKAVKI